VTSFQIFSGFILTVAVFGIINYRFLRLPDVVGITAVAVVVSIALMILGEVFGWRHAESVRGLAGRINFSELLIHGLLGLLLFAGSLKIDIDRLAGEKWMVLVLATVGVVLSTLIVGFALFIVGRTLGADLALIHCMLFGALISPTDPVAVMALLDRAKVPKNLETRIVGESLFNDGAAIVLFLTMLGVAVGGETVSLSATAIRLVAEVVGALAFGAIAGYGAYWLMKGTESYPVEILITLALPTAGYAAAEALHVSAPIAVVLMGLIIGNKAADKAMTADTRRRLFGFWEVIDELLNLLLFGLIGLQMLALELTGMHIVIGVSAIGIVLLARLLSISGPVMATPRLREYGWPSIVIMTWGGLRGGISIALALSLPEMPARDALLVATYTVVIFSILVQALTLGPVARRVLRRSEARKRK
jgi:CPA1 family monovalent cation:H+ antiporter